MVVAYFWCSFSQIPDLEDMAKRKALDGLN